MSDDRSDQIARREFLKRAGLTTAGALLTGPVAATDVGTRVAVLVDPSDEIATAAPARWAVEQLRQALSERGVPCVTIARLGETHAKDVCIVVAGKRSTFGHEPSLPDAAEAFTISRGRVGAREIVFARGSDVRGLVYALTELADAAALSPDAVAALVPAAPLRQRPANTWRSCMRMFSSDVEDKAWFNNREFWKRYLSMLVTQRFNRFNLSFGLAYDFTTEIRDAYLHFAYPFLLKVPGYDVRATNLDAAERDRNLETLRFISDEAAARGLHFQLGLWTHAYEWTRSPDANHRIEGLTPETVGPYCRDALALLLKECPSVSGVTIRTHGESGVAEGSYDLWKQVFDGVRRAGRRVEIDLHAKGLDRKMIDAALATDQTVVLSPKFWAEHMGLPYHQAWIRPTELPEREQGEGLFALSSGSRSFLRYGYGDLLDEQRRYGILHRIWPGTQRLLLWGDPVFAAAYGRSASFCGTQGAELMEPLSFKGRKGSGQNSPRTGYAEQALVPRHDFEKYLYTYRLWGRLLYDPDAVPETWQRLLRKQHGPAAQAVEGALACASRILPLVTTAHTPSAANNHWWPEMYVNMSIVDAAHPEPYTDTLAPKRFGAVSALDPQLFARVDDFAAALVAGHPNGRYTPTHVAASLEDLATQAAQHLTAASSKTPDRTDSAFRRFAIDTGILVELGRFFANKLTAASLYALSERGGGRNALARAIERYQAARESWTRIVAQTDGVYMQDVSYGIAWYQRGHWSDRLAAIDQDLAAMQRQLAALPTEPAGTDPQGWIDAVVKPPVRVAVDVRHTPPQAFRRGQALALELALPADAHSVRLCYRHVNQAEPWKDAVMRLEGALHRTEIPAEYTDSPFPLTYYFEVRAGLALQPSLYPGFNATWSNQPYFVVRQATG